MLRCLLVAALAAPPPATTSAGPSAPAGPTTPARVSPAPSTSAPSTSAPSTSASTSAPASTVAAPTTATAGVATSSSSPTATTSSSLQPPLPATPAATSTLELHSDRPEGGLVTVRDSKGETVATMRLQGDARARLKLPPGTYTVDDTARGGRITLSLEPGPPARFVLTPTGARGTTGEAPLRKVAPQPQRSWRPVVSPVLSAVVPGLGQVINGQPGKGMGILFGVVALGAGALILSRSSGGTDVSTRGLHGSSYGGEVIGAAGYGLLSGGLQMLYASQIMEAHATAAGIRAPRPRTRHRVSVELTRMATIGMRAGDPAAGFFPDWNVTVLGQVARRLSVGAGDLAVKQGQAFDRITLQGGLRLHYRFLERGRVWLGAAAGLIFQGSFGRAPAPRVPASAPDPGGQGSFAAIPYAQLDARFFILHRWSLNLTPRISAPLAGPRFFNGEGERAVARNALTLELGTGVGVYF